MSKIKSRIILSTMILILLLIFISIKENVKILNLKREELAIVVKNNNEQLKRQNTITNAPVEILSTAEEIVTDAYVSYNWPYKKIYTNLVKEYLMKGRGYVSLNRILYFYNANKNLSFREIYEDNLDNISKKQMKISAVCENEKYKELYVCREENVNSSNQIDVKQIKPFTSPVSIEKLNISSFFMENRSYESHAAWDIAAPSNTPIKAVCNGKVLQAGYNGAYGLSVTEKCIINGKTFKVLYAHMMPGSVKIVNGQYVYKNDVIGGVGSTGRSTGYHLHYEVEMDGQKVDGMSLIDFTK